MAEDDDKRWHVYVLPAEPRQGSTWIGSFEEYPDVNEMEGVLRIGSNEEEPVAYVSMATAAGVFIAQKKHMLDAPQPPQPEQTDEQ